MPDQLLKKLVICTKSVLLEINNSIMYSKLYEIKIGEYVVIFFFSFITVNYKLKRAISKQLKFRSS